MTKHHLTDEDLEVLNSGDLDAIKRHVNQMRGELIELQETVKSAVHSASQPERLCILRSVLPQKYQEEQR